MTSDNLKQIRWKTLNDPGHQFVERGVPFHWSAVYFSGQCRPSTNAGCIYSYACSGYHRHNRIRGHHIGSNADSWVVDCPDQAFACVDILDVAESNSLSFTRSCDSPWRSKSVARHVKKTVIELINFVLLGLLVITAIAAIRLHDLFAVTIMFGIYSLLAAAVFIVLDAVDVAFTEAAVGVGISTILMLATIGLVGRKEKPPSPRPLLPLVVVIVTGAALVYGTFDMPPFAAPDAPVQQHVAPRYLEQSPQEIGIPNVVTAVLASYRGYDTLGELTVIFTAGVGVLALLGFRRRRGRVADSPGEKP